MASKHAFVPDRSTKPFWAGNYVFTRAQAQHCATLHMAGVSVWQIKQSLHPNATVEQVIVAIQVGIMISNDGLNLAHLNPKIFKPNLVLLGMWNVGTPNKSNE